MTVDKRHFILAVRNVAQHGDTDVFPFPLENHWFFDDEEQVVRLLLNLDGNFEKWLGDYPVVFDKVLAGVGHAGFRAVTQIDPLWNAYLLALLIQVGLEIEEARIPADRNIVFSYRFRPSVDTSKLFDADLGWGQYHKHALTLAASSEVVASTDISDFYSRIYHHRIQHALSQATPNTEVTRRIMVILGHLSGGTSYGLPVGGPASRLLAELLLNRTDRLLLSQRIQFVRFVDDYFLFGRSREEVQSALVFLSEILLANEGLTLSRSKTRFMTRAEFTRSSPMAEPAVADSDDEEEVRGFLRLRLRFDPYSPTATEDYAKLFGEIQKFDVTKMLARELRKSRIDESLMRHLIKSVRFMNAPVRDGAVASLMENVDLLYPVFPTVAILLKGIQDTLSEPTRQLVFNSVRKLVQSGSHVTLVPTNLAFAIRLMAHDRSEETDALLIDLYNRPRTSILIKREILLAMSRRRVDYWLSDTIKKYSVLTPWEKRSLLVASYVLGDEGRFWRGRIRPELSEVDTAFLAWVGLKNSGKQWEVPI